jgi:cell surface protein SprA
LTSGYYEGYGKSQQQVVLAAFLASYSNKSVTEKNADPIKSTPLPNWSMNYNGLTKFKVMKKYFRNFVVRHAYSSSTSVSGIQTNLNAAFDGNGNATSQFQNASHH